MCMMRDKTLFIVVLAVMLLVTACADTAIDRRALVMRNNPHVTKIDSLHSLTVGNGRFAFTADASEEPSFVVTHAPFSPVGADGLTVSMSGTKPL